MTDVKEMQTKFGNSNEESRQAVIDAHGGVDTLKEWALVWANHHGIFGTDPDIFVAYSTALDLGVRIGRVKEVKHDSGKRLSGN